MNGTVEHSRTDALPAEMRRLRKQNTQLRAENERLVFQNEELREENRRLRAVLDSHLARAQAAALFGPMELSAGTAVGPRRHRSA